MVEQTRNSKSKISQTACSPHWIEVANEDIFSCPKGSNAYIPSENESCIEREQSVLHETRVYKCILTYVVSIGSLSAVRESGEGWELEVCV